MKKRKYRNSYEILQDDLMNLKKEGVLDSLPQSSYEKLMQNVRGKLKSFLLRDLKRKYDFFSSNFKKNFMQAKKEAFSRATGIASYKIDDLNPAFREEYKKALSYSLSLIKTRSEEEMLKLQNRFYNWITLPSVRDKEELYKLTKLPSDKKTKLLLRDQNNKLSANLDIIVAKHYGAICFEWKIRRDNRVAGDPKGLYPKVNAQSKYHGNHYERAGKFWYFSNMPKEIKNQLNLKAFEGSEKDIPDGLPGIPINCRCWMKTYYRLEDLPEKLLKLR